MSRNISANIPKMFVLQSLHWFLLILPTIVLFFQENGLSLTDIFMLQSVFSVSIVVLEIPTGYFADVFGRKSSLVAGFFLGFMGLLTYCFSHGFWGFLAAELTMGLGASFSSGTDQAMLYDSLLELKKGGDYKRVSGKYFSVSSASEGTASVLGGLLAAISFRLPFYVETGLMGLGVLVALTLVEPRRKKFEHPEGSLKGILSVIRFSMSGHPRLKWMILYATAISASTLTMFWFWQPYFSAVGLPVAWLGFTFGGLQFWMSFVSHQAPQIERWMGEKTALKVFLGMVCVGYGLVALTGSLWGVLLSLIFYTVRGFNAPLFSDYVNQMVPSDRRATVLSLQSLLVRLLFSIWGPIAGLIADGRGLSTAIAISGGLFSALGSICLWGILRNRNRTRNRNRSYN